MAAYAISDIHGEYDKFNEVLKKISFKETDTLYVLGDVLDRGPHPIKTLLQIMDMPNAICIWGNHELMASKCLEVMTKDVVNMPLEKLTGKMIEDIITWQYNGASTTITEFRSLDVETQKGVINYIKNMHRYEQVKVGKREYLLVHAGLGNYSRDKKPENYSMEELVWTRNDYSKKYFDKVVIITGHTPTQLITENRNPGYIFRKNNHIAIDCGASYSDGRLAAIRLEDEKEYYSN